LGGAKRPKEKPDLEPVEINAGQWYLRGLRADSRIDDRPALADLGVIDRTMSRTVPPSGPRTPATHGRCARSRPVSCWRKWRWTRRPARSLPERAPAILTRQPRPLSPFGDSPLRLMLCQSVIQAADRCFW